jgi:hypothetical protein
LICNESGELEMVAHLLGSKERGRDRGKRDRGGREKEKEGGRESKRKR